MHRILVGSLLVMLLTACGGGGSGTTSSDNNDETTSTNNNNGADSSGNNDNNNDTADTSGDVSQPVESPFTHPGLLHTEADFERMRTKIAAGENPWAETWNTLINYEDTKLDQEPQAFTTLIRGGSDENYLTLIEDLRAMYGLALAWNITKEDAYGDLAVTFLNDWSSTLEEVTGNTDKYLAAGLYGYQLANIGEIMRSYEGWAEADIERFQTMLLELFYPLNSDWLARHDGSCLSHFWANWDLANITGMMAIGIFADREDIYLEALDYLYHGQGTGALDNLVYYLHDGNMGQYQESGRDQGHSNLGVTLMGVIAKQAWNQGDDLFAWENYRLLSAMEYIARYNVNEEVPFTPYGPNCVDRYNESISSHSRGHKRRSWMLPLNHYRNRLGIATPWMEAKHADVGREVWRWSNDELGWGSLTEALDEPEIGGAPRGLTARIEGDTVVLSWWGAYGAESYQLQRADDVDGEFATIATIYPGEYLTHTDTDVQTGQDYHYRVTALSADGLSEPSKTALAEVGTRLKVHLTFDESESDTLKNSVNDSDIGTLMNGAELVPGVTGQAVSLDGVDDFVQLDEGVVEELSDFTVAAWLHLDEAKTNARLFDFGVSDQRYMTLLPATADGVARFAITKVSYHADEVITANDPLETGSWVHLAVTLKNGVGILYVNGAEAARHETMALAPFRLNSTNQNWLGRSQYSADAFLAGKIDDFRIYSGALSASEIGTLATP
ncbi:LamG-like jellyroll fold domain-containing protein [Microbulbifer rhizosphaerae]|uniref:Fibronectin type-III domain-containing protein n=1 Tax=Microbulbifer rhizosphaerae TaxID=1562603 RepID=A0A7W4Z9R6_9GAMM|nr:LamG-like jellyroll fold domain-containing protein [Microbulbifer rhizosphaerae]MBB3060490.1 hypothetical protein [Microbulbifer rhizosphaerae]